MRSLSTYTNIRHIILSFWYKGEETHSQRIRVQVWLWPPRINHNQEKGKLDLNKPLHFVTSSWKGMKPSTNKYYQVKDLTMYNVITIVIQEYTANSKNKLLSIHLINTDFAKMIPKLKQWLQIDFSTLRKPRLNYKSQTQINPHRVCMANAAMAHFGLNPGRFVRWMGGEYTDQHRDAYSTLAAVKGHVSTEDYKQMKRILLNGCPAQLDF
jgi:hypothetical protein